MGKGDSKAEAQRGGGQGWMGMKGGERVKGVEETGQ